MPHSIAIYDVDGDGDLDCVTAVRTEFIEEPLGATYVLFFTGLNGKPANMANVTNRALARTVTFLLVLAHVHGEVSHRSDDSVLDTFDVLRALPRAVAIYDIDGDGDRDCVTAVRTEFSEEPQKATYVLQFKGLGGTQPRNVTFHITPGSTPDTNQFTLDDDYDFVQVARFYYTNYKNCAVMDHPFENVHECILWTTSESFHDIPEDCMIEYEKTCKDAAKPYDEDSCAKFIF
ncbi:hypothetical protein MTO96_034963 [Rhipicephalus appendiculatus]